MFKYFILALLLIVNTSSFAYVQNFSNAKKQLLKIYNTLESQGPIATIYCNCPLQVKNLKYYQLDLQGCGYEVRKQYKRAHRVEIEHVMPAYDFGRYLQCWQQGGRKNCKKDPRFNMMEGDLHNLYPSVGEINGDRSNFRFTDGNIKPYQYGQCPMVVDFKNRQVQPGNFSKGKIARAYLYMSDRYNIKLSKAQRNLFLVWNKQYRVNEQDCIRNDLIAKIQGNENPYIKEQCSLKNYIK